LIHIEGDAHSKLRPRNTILGMLHRFSIGNSSAAAQDSVREEEDSEIKSGGQSSRLSSLKSLVRSSSKYVSSRVFIMMGRAPVSDKVEEIDDAEYVTSNRGVVAINVTLND
jgi:hypothetical protein